jgi:hypothetical protein
LNRCEKGAFCPLGDTATLIGCRKPHCPKKTMADNSKTFTNGMVVLLRRKDRPDE